MKVTLTEKGVEYRRKLRQEAHTSDHPPEIRIAPMAASIQETQVIPRARTTAFTQRRAVTSALFQSHPHYQSRRRERHEDPTSFIDSLLPAMISKNPPQEIQVRRPQVAISFEFRHRYKPRTASDALTSGFPSTASLLTPPAGSLNLTANKLQATIRAFDSCFGQSPLSRKLLPQSRQQSRPYTTQHKSQLDNCVAALLARSLKRTKIQQKQLDLDKRRELMERRMKDHLEKQRKLQSEDLEVNTRRLGQGGSETVRLLQPQTDKRRYLERITQQHTRILSMWDSKQRTLWLAQPQDRHKQTPYNTLRSPPF